MKYPDGNRNGSCRLAAFTLIELLLVVAIIGILAGLLLPALSSAKAKGNTVACLSNLKQLGLCFQMYNADNDGRFADNLPNFYTGTDPGYSNSWVVGDMTRIAEATNQNLLRQSKFFPYATSAKLFHCPVDQARSNGFDRLRSYSMNCWIGSRYMNNSTYANGAYRTFLKESELTSPAPAALWVMMDESEATIDDGWYQITFDSSTSLYANDSFFGTRHQRGYTIDFADGHGELYKLRDPGTQIGKQLSPTNSDLVRLRNVTTSAYGAP
ncbi:type II secretion system protein [Pedosphaera parvula]|uniref:Type II secretory pathway pseudopilin PulG-like protein n=1 Tax=Pedosphaera parvula (strain Ellin514) TaxID=320771 RepID=B9XGJ0_PEDPL|nr:type II secretion system protein [Pedosphaera parvula]EEF61041.1 hypothetical protein Cflav_PD3758 [Pedosphaera parvula Ellin514]